MATKIRLKRMGRRRTRSIGWLWLIPEHPEMAVLLRRLAIMIPVPAPLRSILTRRRHWGGWKGARPSDTVKSLLRKVGVMEKHAQAQKVR